MASASSRAWRAFGFSCLAFSSCGGVGFGSDVGGFRLRLRPAAEVSASARPLRLYRPLAAAPWFSCRRRRRALAAVAAAPVRVAAARASLAAEAAAARVTKVTGIGGRSSGLTGKEIRPMDDHRGDHRDMRQRRRDDRAAAQMVAARLAIAAFAETPDRPGSKMAGGMPSAMLMPALYDARIADWLSPRQPRQNVVMDLLVDSSGFAAWGSWRMRCALGRSGISTQKREGDGATPVGAFADAPAALSARIARPGRAPPCPARPIAPADGWCDAPADRAYNRRVRCPIRPAPSNLWRDDHLYDLIVVLGYNDDPVVPGQGSAIFLHLAVAGFRADGGLRRAGSR